MQPNDKILEEMNKKIVSELERMNNILQSQGFCSTIEPARIHKLRTDIYDYKGNVN